MKDRRFRFPVSRLDDRAIPSGRPSDHCSIRPDDVPYRPDDVDFCPDHPLCREVSIQLASVRTSLQHVQMPLGIRPVSDSFQVPIKERSINRPDDVVSRSDARLLKERIAIQISPSGCQLASIWTRVQLIWKLLIRLPPSGRLPLMVRMRA
jgi:hypothetical protein